MLSVGDKLSKLWKWFIEEAPSRPASSRDIRELASQLDDVGDHVVKLAMKVELLSEQVLFLTHEIEEMRRIK